MKVPSYFPENAVIEMRELQYAQIGEWNDEPDDVYWTDPVTGYKCEIHRAYTGHLCGYVCVPNDSKLFNMGYDDAYEFTSVHGSLTYAGPLKSDVNGWALGFDCGHAWDLKPKICDEFSVDERYRNLRYVYDEVTKLAQQLHAEINKAVALPAPERDEVREFVTYIFDVVTNDGELYRRVILPEISLIQAYGSKAPSTEYVITDIWKRMASRLINHFRWMDVCEDRTHVFTTAERDMLADMLAEKYDEIVKEGV